jgi:hypothetical protein
LPRIFFRYDLEFTYHAHAMSKWLIRDFGFDDASFSGIVDGRLYYDFLVKKQHDIRYQRLGLNQDILWRARSEPPDMEFLERMERELGVDTLWRLRDAERWIPGYTYTQVLSAMTLMLKYLEREFTEHRPDAVFGFTTATMYGLACFYMAHRFGIPCFEMTNTRLRERYVIEDQAAGETFPHVNTRYAELLAGRDNQALIPEAQRYIEQFRAAPARADGMKRVLEISSSRGSLHVRRIWSLARITYWYYFGHYRNDPEQLHPLKQVLDTLRLVVRQRRLKRGVFEVPVAGERYAYYPMHLQPEATTAVLSPFWVDQLALIENLARSLPVGMRLYVKEHMPMLGYRPHRDYERLRAIPNVRLMHPGVSPHELIRKADIVLTITGTAGIEALLLGTRVITFGEVFYNVVPRIRKVRAIADLPKVIRETLAAPLGDNDQVTAFIAILLDESVMINGDELSVPTRTYEEIERSEIAAALYKGFVRALRRSGILAQ